ncbi:transposase [Citricoccus sp. NR2]|uniref:transposase n=1 Tax=Citricoccus sp. NR2 TaxID=3004095 RepID=UPI0022DDCA91|nr:transposase [Citricoccus sp. NR2]WBL19993.1 transposase [Citricoccus sp. NR2]
MTESTDDWRNGRHVVYRLHALIVLTPKYRRKVMTNRVRDELADAFTEVCGRYGATLDAFETDTDHLTTISASSSTRTGVSVTGSMPLGRTRSG